MPSHTTQERKKNKGTKAAEDALKSLESDETPGAVLMDVRLPGMSGLEALDRIAAALDVGVVRGEQAHLVPCVLDDPADILGGVGYFWRE